MPKVVKETKVEQYACDDISLAIPACAIASSKWNFEAGQDSCVVRVLEISDPCFPPTFEKSKEVRLVLYKAKGNGILNVSEHKSKHYKEDILGEFHASIMVTLRDTIAPDSLEKMEEGDPGFTESFKCLALALRLFSFTAVEPPPPSVPEEGQAHGDGGLTSFTVAPDVHQQQTQAPCVSEGDKALASAPASYCSTSEAPQSNSTTTHIQ